MSRDMTKPTKWLSTQRRLRSAWAHSEDSDQAQDADQTGWMPRLIWVFAGRTLILLVLSCHGSTYELEHSKMYKMSHIMTKPTKWMCAQQRLRSACASAQSDQSLLSAWRILGSLATHCVHSEDWSLGRCPGWSESLLGKVIFVGFVMWWLEWRAPHEDLRSAILISLSLALYGQSDTTRFFMLIVKLIRQCRYASWSESLLNKSFNKFCCVPTHEPQHNKTNKVTCGPCKDSDQPGHLPSLIRVFAVRSLGSQGPNTSSCGQQRLWSDWADAKADLSLCWAHRSLCLFCHEAAHIPLIKFNYVN